MSNTFLTRFFRSKNEREKYSYLLIFAFLLLGSFYHFVITPLKYNQQKLEQNVINNSELLNWIRSVKPQLIHNETLNAPTTQNLFLLIESKMGPLQQKNSQNRLEKGSNNSVIFYSQLVDFSALIKAIYELESQFNIKIKKLSIDRINDTGAVKANIVFVQP